MSIPTGDFFNAGGGTLSPEQPSYVSRRADDELYDGLSRLDYCYVLTARQMGKSSLAIRIAERLAAEGAAIAHIDLTALGHNLDPEQWYHGLLFKLGVQLDLKGELAASWESHRELGPLQRWMQALRGVVLARCPGPVVIVIDEIDYVRQLPFVTDEFFAAIRECYNDRARDPALGRLTFCLLGTVNPSDLIRDPETTPFNIGRRIELADFTAAEASYLARGLGRDAATAARLMRRIHHWTGGQPYLTQRLCQAVAEAPEVVGPAGVDRVCRSLFYTASARSTDKNLQFVGRHILGQDHRCRDDAPDDGAPATDRADEMSPEDRRRSGLLDLYARVHRGRDIADDEKVPLIGALRLSGIVRVVDGRLRVRNRIYRHVFDRRWIRANVPPTLAQIRREAYLRGVRRATVIAASVIGLTALGGYWVWDTYYRLKTSYYAGYVKRHGVYEGVGRLSPEEVRHRMASLRFSSRNRQVEKVEVVNAAGHLTSPDFLPTIGLNTGEYLVDARKLDGAAEVIKACQWEFVRDSEGRVVYEATRDKANRLVGGLLYVPTNEPNEVKAFYIDRNGYPQARSGSGAAYVRIVRTARGFDREVRYLDVQGRPQPDHQGVFGERRQLDPRSGLVVAFMSLGPDGEELMYRKDGMVGGRSSYDKRGCPVEITAVDITGKPVLSSSGVAIARNSYDPWGNHSGTVHYDARGRVTADTTGVARWRRTFDPTTNRIELTNYDVEGRPVQAKDGHARWTARYDARGNLVEAAFSDEVGRPARHKDGYARWTARYDARGNRVEEAYFDEAGRPARHKDGFARWTARYDARGNQVEWVYFDEAGGPARHNDGYARATARYDERGNPVETAYFDEAGRPARHKNGFARMAWRYDARGNWVEEAYFDEAGGPARHNDGYARTTARYDERGNPVETAYFDEEGRPAPDKDGHARWTARFDARGNRVEAAYFDEAGRPARHKDGYARVTTRFDERGNKVEEAYFDEAGRPVRIGSGYARWTAHYDARGNRVEEAYFDEAGRPARHKDGFARWTGRHDARGNQVEWVYFDEAGGPARHNDGYARTTARYDERGNRVEEAYFDEAGRPARHKDGFARWTGRHDARGNQVEWVYFDEAGGPARHNDGYARTTARYDERGNPVETAYFDEAGRPARHKNGFARMAWRYDARGNWVEEAYFDEAGGPARHNDGYARTTARYDARGNQVEAAYFDETGEPVRTKDGYAKWVASYDDKGTRIGVAYYDTDGAPIPTRPVVVRIVPGGQAEEIALKPGDVILGYDGKEGFNGVSFISAARAPGEGTRELRILRDGEVLEFQVRPGLFGMEIRDRAGESVIATQAAK